MSRDEFSPSSQSFRQFHRPAFCRGRRGLTQIPLAWPGHVSPAAVSAAQPCLLWRSALCRWEGSPCPPGSRHSPGDGWPPPLGGAVCAPEHRSREDIVFSLSSFPLASSGPATSLLLKDPHPLKTHAGPSPCIWLCF